VRIAVDGASILCYDEENQEVDMKFDSGRVVIWGTGLWIYALLVLGLSEMVDVSLPFVAVTYIPVIALYLFLIRRENKKLSPAELASREPQGLLGIRQRAYTRRDFIESCIAVFGSVILAFLTVVYVVRPDMGFELTESIKISRITCERDQSKITTLPVNKTVELDGTKITVYNVTYNVPGQDEHPVEFPDKYHCAKATFVEVTVDRPEAIDYKGSRDISLRHTDNDRFGEPPRYYGIDDWSGYIDKNKMTVLNDLDFTYKQKIYQKRGWLLFRLPEEYPDSNNSIVYSVRKYGSSDKQEVSIQLPGPGNR
jgi:hypothetical protein